MNRKYKNKIIIMIMIAIIIVSSLLVIAVVQIEERWFFKEPNTILIEKPHDDYIKIEKIEGINYSVIIKDGVEYWVIQVEDEEKIRELI